MRLRRLLPILVSTFASVSVVSAQPADKKKAPPPAPVTTDGGAPAVPKPDSTAPTEDDTPPKDMEGLDENPTNPNGIDEEPATSVTVPVKKKTAGYPIEEYARPINLPENMSEVSIAPHIQVGQGNAGGDALRARYGITREVQLGLTYVYAGIYDDPATMTSDAIGFHGGKAVGLDVTILLQDWIGIRVGVPVYLKPVALSLALGVPMKFQFGDKFAIGGLDDLLNIRLKRFAPTFYEEAVNANNAQLDSVNSTLSNGTLRISAFGVYQHKPNLALIGRIGGNVEDFTVSRTQSNAPDAGLTYFLRAGVSWSPKKYLDVGGSIGFDDLAHAGSFGPAGYLAFRI